MAMHLRRRELIFTLGCAAAWPLAAHGQQRKLPTIGFLGAGTAKSNGLWLAAFLQRLHKLGWFEGRNLAIEYRWANGSSDRAAEFAAEFVQSRVDVILTYANPIVLAVKHATSLIPIIFAAAADPLGTGLVAIGRTHGCTDQACKREESSCQLGAVHTWPFSDLKRCPLMRPLPAHKLTSNARAEPFRF